MKALYTSLIVAGLIAITGCNTSPTGGGAGGTGGSGKHGEASKATFKLSGPSNTPETSVKQGETIVKDITVDSGKDFKENITFDAKVDSGDKKGVTAKVEPKMWKASEHETIKLHITASEEAPQGEYTIHVTGTPATGKATTLDVKIKVPEKNK